MAHRPKHKTVCKKRASELFNEALYKTPPPNEDCSICFLRLPLFPSEIRYQSCCGKIICYGCAYADMVARESAEVICPFCRAPHESSYEEDIERLKKRIEARDAVAIFTLGCRYSDGEGVSQDFTKALELWHQAANLGCAKSHSNIGTVYYNEEGVEKDTKKGRYHWERAAMGGDVLARYNLGIVEGEAGNTNRAMKHFMISAAYGYDDSLKKIKTGFLDGHATKDDFEKALRAHKESKDEMQSDHRDAAREYVQRTQLHQ
ncbi:hypothetical protein ACHAXR_005530 [Thalassiosira sp. AJA248-18]